MTARAALGVAAVVLAVMAGAERLTVRTLIVEGNAALQRHDVPAAERQYRAALERRPASGMAYVGLGTAAYQEQRYADAVQAFARASLHLRSPADRSRASYNLGNASFALGRLDDALEAYKAALRIDPSDEDARYNFALVWQQRERERSAGATSMSSRRAEQLVDALGRPRVRISGQTGSVPPRPDPGATQSSVDK